MSAAVLPAKFHPKPPSTADAELGIYSLPILSSFDSKRPA
ncbi:hypothetical protein MUK42_35228 [Musa troglodytarum]|uniref:Uncharacterized protein n=1 Tax=Musa troglodytarum TaxID=320322 RepID=A0A9E7KQ89_9LILI|nr:hypothetical protein MUK42_35228 [Musa troglodytarum]